MKSLQRKVTRSLPHKTKRGLKHPLPISSIVSRKSTGSSSCTDISPLTDDSGSRHENIENEELEFLRNATNDYIHEAMQNHGNTEEALLNSNILTWPELLPLPSLSREPIAILLPKSFIETALPSP